MDIFYIQYILPCLTIRYGNTYGGLDYIKLCFAFTSNFRSQLESALRFFEVQNNMLSTYDIRTFEVSFRFLFESTNKHRISTHCRFFILITLMTLTKLFTNNNCASQIILTLITLITLTTLNINNAIIKFSRVKLT